MAEHDGILFALANDGGLWTKANEDWKLLFRESLASGQHEFAYSMLARKQGGYVITCARHVSLCDAQGHETARFTAPGDSLFISCQFADESETKLIVEASAYLIYTYDLESKLLEPWTEGIDVPTSTTGPAHVRKHGSRYLASIFSSIYITDDLQQPWRPLYREGKGDFDWFCRDLISHDPDRDEWLLADGSGLHLLTGKSKARTIFADAPDNHDLILNLIRFREDYLISFARLKDGCMGVRVSSDLTSVSEIRMQE